DLRLRSLLQTGDRRLVGEIERARLHFRRLFLLDGRRRQLILLVLLLVVPLLGFLDGLLRLLVPLLIYLVGLLFFGLVVLLLLLLGVLLLLVVLLLVVHRLDGRGLAVGGRLVAGLRLQRGVVRLDRVGVLLVLCRLLRVAHGGLVRRVLLVLLLGLLLSLF